MAPANNAGGAVKTDPTIVALRFGDHGTKECWESFAQKCDQFQTLRNKSQQHATGCANGRGI